MQNLGQLEGFADQVTRVRDFEMTRDLSSSKGQKYLSPRKKEPLKFNDESNLQAEAIKGKCYCLFQGLIQNFCEVDL